MINSAVCQDLILYHYGGWPTGSNTEPLRVAVLLSTVRLRAAPNLKKSAVRDNCRGTRVVGALKRNRSTHPNHPPVSFFLEPLTNFCGTLPLRQFYPHNQCLK